MYTNHTCRSAGFVDSVVSVVSAGSSTCTFYGVSSLILASFVLV